MAKNVNSLQSGMVQSNDVNNPSVRTYRGKNNFPQSFQHPSTTQYGVVDPVCVAKCEPGDVFPYKFVTDLNTFTLKSPMKSQVKMYSAAFKVPMKAIYPRNWDIMLPIPNKGDDVPDNVRSIIDLSHFLDRVISFVGSSASLNDYIRSVFLLESVFSDGSIFSKMNMHLNDLRFSTYTRVSTTRVGDYYFDEWFDQFFIPWLRDDLLYVQTSFYLRPYDDSDNPFVFYVSKYERQIGRRRSDNSYYISFARAVELLRTGDYELVGSLSEDSDAGESQPLLSILVGQYIPQYLNIEPIIAYQLSCVHFFNNPKVDYIFDVALWRANLETLVLSNGSIPSFEYNGTNRLYDVTSKAFMDFFIDNFNNDPATSYAYFFALFSFQRSLRYGDYFTGAHTEPLAVGDINIDTSSGNVDSLEVVRKLQLTRLLNKANIAGPRKDDYLRVVFGQALPEAPDDVPIRLSREEFDVSGFEVNNTGSDQLDEDTENITTTNLRLTDNRFMFEVQVSDPCWLVMVQYFEAHRIYSKTIDRMAFHFDRYDDFIPDLQFEGDQDVMAQELSGLDGSEDPFAYNLRYMEYKQRYSYASGGFIRRLKSWAFITDNTDGNPATGHITPDYIRSSPSEFDRFYKSLTGWSLGTRFHFITFNTNVAAPYRQMVYAPEILA